MIERGWSSEMLVGLNRAADIQVDAGGGDAHVKWRGGRVGETDGVVLT